MKLNLIFALIALPLWARAEISEDIKSRLAPFEVLKGDFSQSKSIRIIKKPLKSSGHFTLLKDKGVLWCPLKPLPSTLKVTRGEITQIKNGKASFTLKAGEQPALKLVGDVLFAVFSADVAELKKHFEITGTAEAGHWKAALAPKEPWVAKVAKEIHIEGGKTVDAIVIDEANGDQTRIQFLNVKLKSPLTADEKALFE